MPETVLAEPLTLRCGTMLPNRIAKAAMTEGLANPLDQPGEALSELYRRWSLGGAGLLVTGNVMIDRRWLERPGNVVLDDDFEPTRFAEWARAGTTSGNQFWMQISHPGRQCNRWASEEPVSSSDVRLDLAGMFATPRPLNEEEIEATIGGYVRAAKGALETGFTGVQIHAAHGYLISQFLSPLTNRRTDDWGGALPNRARFLLEIVRRCRRVLGDRFPIAVKLNSADFQKGGFQPEEAVTVARWLDECGIDLLEISGGTYEQPQLLGHQGRAGDAAPPKRESTRAREAYFLSYARAIAEVTEVPLMVTGGFRSRAVMEEALRTGQADLIGLARPLAVDPHLPRELLEGATEAAERYEDRLHLGHGFFGPTSPLLPFKIVNVQGEVAWFYRQIVRLAQGREPDRELGLVRALAQHLANELRLNRRRARRQKQLE